ncbi:MAG TPA: hypothetical protein VMG10_15465 [Gemmataceae bacterium]|nr:hypothetical protein [Gemmataceae bacterium]
MSMWKGEPVDGPAFYELLCADDTFCAQLGRAVLAAGRLESALKRHITENEKNFDLTRATLGKLVTVAGQRNFLSRMIPALEMLRDQRNYLTHNVHALLSGLIEETILEGSNLLDSDVHTYTERAWQLSENLNDLAEIVEAELMKLSDAEDRPIG